MSKEVNYLNSICKEVNFERAILLSWYCANGDCTFCYMSTQKNRIKNPKTARRSKESIYAEALIANRLGWKIEFLSGGYNSYSIDELVEIVKNIHTITKQKQWLNIGALNKGEIQKFLPYIEGIAGTVECINPDIRKKVCPSKPMCEIISMFKSCDELGLKKTITIIVGLGETINDFESLSCFIKKNNLSRITFYALNPHKGTPFKRSPTLQYYAELVKKTRESFPKLDIIVGIWSDKINYIGRLLRAGANSITKFPALKLFGSKLAEEFEKEVKKAERVFTGTFTKMPSIEWEKEIYELSCFDEEMKKKINMKVTEYIAAMKQKA